MPFFRLFIAALILVLLSCTKLFAQLPTFSGFWITPRLTAPTAMAGNDAYELTAHYRRLGSEESSGYRTFMLSGQIPLYNNRNTHFGTVGINLLRDESGASYLFATTGAMLTYLYDARITQRHHLVGGVQAGYYSRKIDWGSVTTNNQFVNGGFDPAMSTGEEFSDDPSTAFLTNVGLAYYLSDYEGNPVIHIGGAIKNANAGSFTYTLDNENQAVPKTLAAYAHIRLISNAFYEIRSNLYWNNQSKIKDFVGGLQLRKGTNQIENITNHHLGIGLYYSRDHSGILALQLVQPKWQIGISYDMIFGNNALRQMQNAVEVSLGWRAIQPKGRKQKPGRNRRELPWHNKNKLPWQ